MYFQDVLWESEPKGQRGLVLLCFGLDAKIAVEVTAALG